MYTMLLHMPYYMIYIHNGKQTSVPTHNKDFITSYPYIYIIFILESKPQYTPLNKIVITSYFYIHIKIIQLHHTKKLKILRRKNIFF